MVMSFTVYLISFVIFFFSKSYFVFISAMCLYAIADAFRTGTHKAMIFEYLKIRGWSDSKVSYYGHTRSWSQFGSAISSLLAALLVFVSGNYEFAFLFSIIPYLIGLFLMISYPRALDGAIDRSRKAGQKQIFRKVFLEFISAFKSVTVINALANVSSFSAYFRAVKDYLQPEWFRPSPYPYPFLGMDDEKRTAILIGLVYFVIYLLSSFAARNSGNVSKHFRTLASALNLMLIIGLISGILSGLFYNLGFAWIAILSFC